ncbi:quinone oxidoreductase family protein [Sediminibacillus albus]|uniref:NADPH2:quinone reductase n=1 Tax=Sediminibacillus albus TaxID=407036 RepID=A0A1G8VI23_9BACI|nr:zinc-binding dehydrogenase [Sediminibacillus albus]SDJ65766.1 NADPH2:quinone reductase [Sediminibacillus albus]
MKTILIDRYGGPEVLQMRNISIPMVKDDEVLIKVAKTSVNFADIKNRSGKKKKGSLPFIPGLDAAGVVEQVGKNVHSVLPGDRVITFPKGGSYAEYVVAKQSLTFKIPDEMGFNTAAACPTVSFLAYKLLNEIAKIKEGETVLVHAAAGGVGSTAIQLARLFGAKQVIGTVSDDKKFPVVLESGADHVILYDNFAEKVNGLTGGNGVDIILDSISGKIFEESLHCLTLYGRIVHFGNSGGRAGVIETDRLHASCRSVLGFSLGTTRKERPELLRETSAEVLRYLSAGQLKIKVGETFSLEDAAEAHKLMESRRSTGKILLDVSRV